MVVTEAGLVYDLRCYIYAINVNVSGQLNEFSIKIDHSVIELSKINLKDRVTF